METQKGVKVKKRKAPHLLRGTQKRKLRPPYLHERVRRRTL